MKTFGLGDLAYYLFRPVVIAIDLVWGTDLRDCTVCKARRKRWNRWSIPRPLAIVLLVTVCAFLICSWTR